MLLELQREIDQLRREMRTLGPAREGDRPRDGNEGRGEAGPPREGAAPRSSARLLPSATEADPALAQLVSSDLQEAAIRAMKKAATFYHDEVASHGGYVYYYSLDLQQRWGEGKASPDTIFVQPPGTPTVGMAYLKACEATGDRFYLDAAREAAEQE